MRDESFIGALQASGPQWLDTGVIGLNRLAGDNLELGRFRPDAELFVLRPWRSAMALAADWLLIGLSFALAMLLPHPLSYAIAVIVIARSQLALAVMMHEAAHGLLARRRRVNDAIGQALAAGPLWLSLRSYRNGHLQHHRAPMRHDDPVAVVFGIGDYPVKRPVLVRRLLTHACGIGYFATVLKLLRADSGRAMPKAAQSPAHIVWELATMLAANALLFAILASMGHPLLYIGLWLVPAVTLLPFAGQVRAIFEHAGLPECADQSRSARTITRRSWQTFLFGPHAVHYHIEHHLFARLPFYSLAAAHRQLAQRLLLPVDNLYTGYGRVLRDVSRP